MVWETTCPRISCWMENGTHVMWIWLRLGERLSVIDLIWKASICRERAAYRAGQVHFRIDDNHVHFIWTFWTFHRFLENLNLTFSVYWSCSSTPHLLITQTLSSHNILRNLDSPWVFDNHNQYAVRGIIQLTLINTIIFDGFKACSHAPYKFIYCLPAVN